MNPLRRLTEWWRTHRPVIVARASYQHTTQRLFALMEQHCADQQRLSRQQIKIDNLLAQSATQRSLLAANEREATRQRVAYDQAVDKIAELLEENRHLKQDNAYHHEAARWWMTLSKEPHIYHN